MIGASLDNAWRLAASFAGVAQDESRWSAALSALNGVVGDHLAKSGNPLAIAMHLRCEGRPLALDDGSPLVLPGAGAKVALLIHGLCMSELQWTRRGHDHGKLMRQTLGYTPVYLRYNSGRSVFENGRELAGLLEQLLERWPLPIEELVILAHSMGGLVARSAVHQAAAAGRRWPSRLRKLVFLGTPHHGAPLERGGNWLQHVIENSPYTAPLARLGKLRSSGVTDLRFGNVVAEDLADADRFAHAGDRRRPIPLPREVACFAVAGALGRHERALGTRLLGDGLVPIDSALGRHAEPERSLDFPDSQRWIAYGCNHWDLLDRPEVAEQLCQWLGGAREP